MKLQVTGLSHHTAPVHVREKLAFTPQQASDALARFRLQFPQAEGVLLSTCNRVELYAASEIAGGCPTHHDIVSFLADFHGLSLEEVFDELFERTGDDAVRHLFSVAASLDSMVVGEAQILGQVKQAYDLATGAETAGPVTHAAFQAAIRTAKRVASETRINEKRVSIPSVAVCDFARGIFERFDDKLVVVIGAGEMAEETLTYLHDEGARRIVVVNRNLSRAERLAERFRGRAEPWERLLHWVADADVVVATTGAAEPVVTLEQFRRIEAARAQRTLFVLDLAIPRDFAPEIGECIGVYLYSIDDLQATCDQNRAAREREWPKAERIIEDETGRFMADLYHRATGPTIRRLKAWADGVTADELGRLWKRTGDVDPRLRSELERAVERIVNKLLHPPLESLRDESVEGTPHGLLEALVRLFKLKD